MLKSKVIITCIYLCAIVQLQAQDFPSEYWHKGYAVLLKGDTVKGEIKYDLENNLIQVKTKKRLGTFSARKLLFFEFQDAISQNFRLFYALPYFTSASYSTPVLFEIMVEGPVSLLVREKLKTETINTSPYYPSMNYNRVVLDHDIYFLDLKGGIMKFSGKKNDAYKYFQRKEVMIRDYAKVNRLDPSELPDLIRITSYYNKLIEQ